MVAKLAAVGNPDAGAIGKIRPDVVLLFTASESSEAWNSTHVEGYALMVVCASRIEYGAAADSRACPRLAPASHPIMIESLKHLAYRLPVRYQQDLKRLWFGNKLRRRTLVTDEPEFARLPEWLGEGDWALDVGANIGHYTVRMSELVGRGGRVLAFEPVPRTFELLAANVALLPLTNVSLFNVAASDGCRDVGMRIPHFDGGPLNYYEAKITTEDAHLRVLSVRLDSLGLREPIKLVKIDAEGHELSVLQGMTSIIERDRPRIIAEGAHEGVEALLREFGYRSENAPRSPNRVYQIA